MVQLKVVSLLVVAFAALGNAFVPQFNGAITKAAAPATIMEGRGDSR